MSNLEKSKLKLLDPATVYIKGELKYGKNVVIETNVIFEGEVFLGDNVKVRANTIIVNSKINSDTEIKYYSLIKNSIIGKSCMVGPYARLRTGSNINDYSQIGTFVEIKNSIVGKNCKINHMAFIGDATIAENVIIGAGSITCNHDGKQKQNTIINSGVYIGSNVNLIAPIEIGENAIIGAGSTISKDVPKNKLTIERSEQISLENKLK